MERVTVVGHSLGGGVAMQFSYQYPEYCERIVLVDSGGLGREVSVALRAATLPGAEFVLPIIASTKVRDAGAAVGRVLGRLPMRPRPSVAEVVRGYASLSETTARAAFVHTLRSVVEPGGQRVSAHDRLYLSEGMPTLIIWGQLDTVIPVARHDARCHPGQRTGDLRTVAALPAHGRARAVRPAPASLRGLHSTRAGQPSGPA